MQSTGPEPHAIAAAVRHFDAHHLGDLGKAALMRRFDSKFILPFSQLPAVLDAMRDTCTALEIEGRRIFRYESHYFDTPSMDFFQMHHNGRLNRYKVRQRVYADTDTRFLEVKFKDNRQRTEKVRIQTTDRPGEIREEGLAFLDGSVPHEFRDLHPSLEVAFRRIALAGKTSPERVTLDFDLAFEPPGAGHHKLSQLLVVELKQPRLSVDSPLFRALRKLNVRPQSFSKYCIGCCLAERGGKANRFKPTLSRVRDISKAS